MERRVTRRTFLTTVAAATAVSGGCVTESTGSTATDLETPRLTYERETRATLWVTGEVANPNDVAIAVAVEGRFVDAGELLDSQITTIEAGARERGAWGIPLDGRAPNGLLARERALARSIDRVEARLAGWCALVR